jgi:hypothetical protein
LSLSFSFFLTSASDEEDKQARRELLDMFVGNPTLLTNDPPSLSNGRKTGATAFERSRLLNPVRSGTRAYTISVNQQYQKGMVGPNKNIKQRQREEDKEYWQMVKKFIAVSFVFHFSKKANGHRLKEAYPGYIALHSEVTRSRVAQGNM